MTGRPGRVGALVLTLALAVSSRAIAQTSDDLFNPDSLQRIDLWLNSTDWSKLKAAFQENTYYPADVTWNGQTVRNVGIRSRGLGSRSATKPGLRVDIDRYSTDQTFLGLNSFVLDNLTQDASGIKETTTMRLFQRLGVPAPRETHTRLYVNGVYAGVYGLIEEIDKKMLARVYGTINGNVQNDGYLFEYKYQLGNAWRFAYEGADLAPYKTRFSIKTNDNHSDAKIWGPIEELVRLVNSTDPAAFDATIASKLDLAEFVRFLAVQAFVAENDGFNGYAGMNNFYLYRLEDSSVHQIIAWDDDNAFLASDFSVTTRVDENNLSRKVLSIDRYRTLYFDTLNEAAASAEGWMRAEMQKQFDLLGGAMQEDTQKPYSNSEHAAERDRLLAFSDARISFVRCEVAKATSTPRPAGCQ